MPDSKPAIGNLVRFIYLSGGEKQEHSGDIFKITSKRRVIAEASGIGVYQGISLKRILEMHFTPIGGMDGWVLFCFEEQRAIGKRLFDKRVKKLERTLERKRGIRIRMVKQPPVTIEEMAPTCNIGIVGNAEKGSVQTPILFPAPKMRVRIGRLGFHTSKDLDLRAYRQLWWRFYWRRGDYDPAAEFRETFGDSPCLCEKSMELFRKTGKPLHLVPMSDGETK